MRVKCLAQEQHNTLTWPGLEPGPLDPESRALITRPPHQGREVLEYKGDGEVGRPFGGLKFVM